MSTQTNRPSVHLIACGVLGLDLRTLLRTHGLDVKAEFLPGGLHNTPRVLRQRLQERIDAISEAGTADRIAIGYGVCGLGSAGLQARNIPLVIPRVQDCIALFLGSDTAYRDQFARYPGTYYIAAGWVEEGTEPLSQSDQEQPKLTQAGDRTAHLVELYGQENGEAIKRFLNSWQRNYQRAVFIDTGIAGRRDKYAALAEAMAEEYGWKYEALPGSHDLLSALLTTQSSTDAILVVPPGYATVYDPASRGLRAVPPHEAQTGTMPETRHIVMKTASHASGMTAHLGLGIDAGGTYTDAVIYDFTTRTVLSSAKAPTTRWDLTEGVRHALGKLDPDRLKAVNLVSVSTTLATNAIVEGHGQKVGLLLMPPYGRMEHSNFTHAPIAVIEGQMEIDGSERQPVNETQVRTIVKHMLEHHAVEAFAVAGYASHVNPAHEVAVRAMIRDTTHLPVTCGHEISEGLNYRVKAETAALNARIIPCLASLLEKVETVLGEWGLAVPTMVVKSDGSLMSVPTALERPIETILSGPAASVAGARRLTGETDALVVDIGGTTTDTATLEDGHVAVCEDGATVGGWRTHVRALSMRTLGLGGDSLVVRKGADLLIGPRRVLPVCRLLDEHPESADALSWIEANPDLFETSSEGMDILALSTPDPAPTGPFHPAERRILDALADGPCCVRELARRIGSHAWRTLPLSGLEATYRVQRAGLTPTDMLHANGMLTVWDRAAAVRIRDLYATLDGCSGPAFSERVLDKFRRLLAMELVKTQLPAELDPQGLENSPVAKALIENAFGGSEGPLAVVLRLHRPVIGLGAPAGRFLPAAAETLHARAIIPPHAEVANAVGAITSPVLIRRHATLITNETGRYTVAGPADSPGFDDLEAASAFAVEALTRQVRELGRQAGTSETAVDITVHDNIGTLSDGNGLFLGRTFEACLTGSPDLALVTASP